MSKEAVMDHRFRPFLILLIILSLLVILAACGEAPTSPVYLSVSYTCSDGGQIAGMNTQYLLSGQDAGKVIAIPDEGYRFIKWSDGVTTADRTDTDVTCALGIKAYFEKTQHALTYTAQEGGSIQGAATQTVNYGESGTAVSALPAPGYEFVGWSDGVSAPERTDTAVKADLSPTALFRRITYQVSFQCAPNQGSITGATMQTVAVGGACSTVKATPALGYKLLCWSDGTLSEEITYTPGGDAALFALFAVDAMELPIITINTEGFAPVLTKEDYVNCTVSVSNTNYEHTLSGEGARIKLRGNSTATLDKKPYKLKFDSKVDLFGNGKAKEWCLIANYSDYSQIRNYIAYTLAAQTDTLQSTTTVQFVELYLNGRYDDVYLVCEQTEVGSTRVDISDDLDNTDTGYLIELDARAPDEGTLDREYFTIDGTHYAVKSPDPEEDDYTTAHTAFIKNYLVECLAALDSGDYEQVCDLIDVNTFADAYIIHELLHCADIGFSSFYMYKPASGKLFCGPLWDFDLSAGNHEDSAISQRYDYLYAKEGNVWYKKLLNYEEFRNLVAQKLASYEEGIIATIEAAVTYVTEHKGSFMRNFERWDILGKYVWPNPPHLVEITTWEGHLEQVTTFLANSLAYMKTQYPAPVEP